MKNRGITATARTMARRGKTEAEIRAALAGHHPASIHSAIFQARAHGWLPPRGKLHPRQVHISLPDDCVEALTRLSVGRGVAVATIAKQIMVEQLRGGA